MGFFNKEDKKQAPQEVPKQETPASIRVGPEPQTVIKGNSKVNSKKQPLAPCDGGESIIVEGTVLTGELNSDRTIIVHGTIKGKVNIKSDLVVAESGLVEADVTAENVSISGRIKGRTEARRLFELKNTGTIEGEIVAKSVKIDEGGRVIGKIEMQLSGSPQATAKMDEADIRKKKEFLRGDLKEPSEPKP